MRDKTALPHISPYTTVHKFGNDQSWIE